MHQVGMRNLKARRKIRVTNPQTVADFATHDVRINPLVTRRGACGVTIATGGGPKPRVTLIAGNRQGRSIKPRKLRNGRILQFVARPQKPIERKKAMLITSGRKNAVLYAIPTSTLRR